MQNLLTFLSQHFHWLLFLILEAVSAVMLFSYNSYQASVWVSSANAVVGGIYQVQSSINHFFSLSQRNEELTTRNLYLEHELERLRTKYAEVTGDTTEAQRRELEQLSQFELIPAKVVSNTLTPSGLITIDKGSADGVKTDMGVASGNGLVGVVYLVGPHYSVVIPALNNHSRISCSIRGRSYFGYLTWDGKDPSFAYIEDVPRHAKFRKGDWIETSGYSSIFPRGVSVGQIEKIYNSRDGLSYKLLIHLATDFACLRDVCVINDTSLAERMRLEQAANDSLALTKSM